MSPLWHAANSKYRSPEYWGYAEIIWAPTWPNHSNDCAPSEDSDQPGHPPNLIRVIAVLMKKAWVLSYPLSGQRRLWSDLADTQADLSLRWAHSHFVGFVMSRPICSCTMYVLAIIFKAYIIQTNLSDQMGTVAILDDMVSLDLCYSYISIASVHVNVPNINPVSVTNSFWKFIVQASSHSNAYGSKFDPSVRKVKGQLWFIIYIKLEVLERLMLYTKCQWHRSVCFEEECIL